MAASTPNNPGGARHHGATPTPEDWGLALRGSHLALAIDRITEPWSNAIIRAAFLGARHFEMFQQALGVPRQTLSLRLSALVRMGLLRRQRYQQQPARDEYRLTPLGKDLYGNVLASWLWDRRWGDPHQLMPQRLVHQRCDHACKPLLVCTQCDQPLSLARMQPVLLPSGAPVKSRTERNRRWRSPRSAQGADLQRDLLAVIDDRWSLLLVATMTLGLGRYEEFLRALEISTAVLAQRLQRLCALELLTRQPDPNDARRAVYRLAPAGRALFPYLLTLSAWGRMQTTEPDTLAWVHRSCTQATLGRVACNHCRATLLPQQVLRPAALSRPALTG
ncbi:MAG: hypothetical protein RIS90_662 [Pseudomonadota bacterium]|jgi:DNA-binding HxlR family transcriptional regulator